MPWRNVLDRFMACLARHRPGIINSTIRYHPGVLKVQMHTVLTVTSTA